MTKKRILGASIIICISIFGITLWIVNSESFYGESVQPIDSNKVKESNEEEYKEEADTVNKNQPSKGDEKKIYGVVETENSWAINPTIPENLIMDEEFSIVQLKVLAVGEAEILPATDDFNSPFPFTPIEVEIIDTFSGEILDEKQIIYMRGGDIKISKLIEGVKDESITKMGLNDLSSDEKETMYISYVTDYDYQISVGEEYGVILVKQTEGIYSIMANGYGIFEFESNNATKNFTTSSITNSTSLFKNVLTGKETDLESLGN